MLPFRDRVNLRTRPFVTWSLMLLCAALFLWIREQNEPIYHFFHQFGLTPGVLSGERPLRVLVPELPAPPPWMTVVTSIFLHASWAHLIGNMLFLWVFGPSIEDAIGHFKFLIFFLLCGVIAAGVHFFFNIESKGPLIGASGAIAGVLAASLLLYPRAKLLLLVFFVVPIRVRAFILIIGWFAIQLFNLGNEDSGVAWYAHVGGFIGGFVLLPAFKKPHIKYFQKEPPPRFRKNWHNSFPTIRRDN